MHNFLLLNLTILLIATALGLPSRLEERIVGGADTRISIAPHLVSIRHKVNASTPFQHRCSGTIHTPHIILTTAFCLYGTQPQHLQVVAGSSYRTQGFGYVHRVHKYVLHPDFDLLFYDNDLALLYVTPALVTNDPSQVAPIAVANALPVQGTRALVAGWGAAADGADYVEQVQRAHVALVGWAQCGQSYGVKRLTLAMLCAGAASASGYVDACRGDAGSALVVDNMAVGLVSWGSGCARANFPGVYTNLVHLSKWIGEQMGGN